MMPDENESTARPSARYDVVIIGAGMAGCAVAQALARADRGKRRKILVIDRHKGSAPRFAGEFIHPRGAQVLDDLGFYGPLKAAGAVDVDGFTVRERADGRYVELPYAAISGQRAQGIAVHHKTLVRVMREVIRGRPQVDLLEGWTIKSLLRGFGERVIGAVLVGPDGAAVEVRADVVVGADGKASQVRRLSGQPDERRTIGFTAGLEVRDAAVPAATWGNIVLGAWGPVLIYPIHRDAQGLTYRVTLDLPAQLPAKGARLGEFLLETFIPYLPTALGVQLAAAIEGDRGPFEMAPTVNLPAPRASAPGLVLVGDAAGCSHPITASGMTMGLRDAEVLGEQARTREDASAHEPWLDDACVRRYRAEHDRYVPTRQALADAIYEVFRGGNEGARAIQRALFDYWEASEESRTRSMALLSCAEGRPSVFLTEYLKTARHALETSLVPRHALAMPVRDRLRQVTGAALLASNKLGLVAQVMWAQVRPSWLPHREDQV